MRYLCVGLALMLALPSSANTHDFKLFSRIESLSRDAVRILVGTSINPSPKSEAKAQAKRFFGAEMMDTLVELSVQKAIAACSAYERWPRMIDTERIVEVTDAPSPSLAKIRLGVRVWFSCGKTE